MMMRILFLLIASTPLLFLSAHSLPNFSSAPKLSSTGAIENSTSFVDSETTLSNVKGDQESATKSCNSDFDPQLLDLVNLSQLRFVRTPGHVPESNSSSSLLVFDRSTSNSNPNGSYAGLSSELQKSVELLLESNNLNSLNVTIFQYSRSLKILMINSNNLSILPLAVFRNLVDLRIITLNENNFTHIPDGLFVHNKKLRTVELVNNKVNITKIPSRLFSGLGDLKAVFLQNIGLQKLPEDLFWSSSDKLKQIDLSRNHLKNLPKNLLRDVSNLQFLDLSFNQLTTVASGFFFGAKQLFELDLSNNNIKALPNGDLFLGLSNLRILNMENNSLSWLHAEAFIALSSLSVARFAHNHINLSTGLYNQFGQISPFHHCPNLTVLNLSHNNVSEMFSDWIVNHTHLHTLDLSYNNFSYLEANDLLFQANNLEVNLTHNSIKIVNLTRVKKFSDNPKKSHNVMVDLNDNPLDCYCDAYSLVRYVHWCRFKNKITRKKFVRPEDLNNVQLKVDNLKCHAPEDYRGTSLGELYCAKLTCSVDNGRSAACASGGACDCHIETQSPALYLNCDGRNLTEAPAWINVWDIAWIYVNMSNNALQKAPNMKNSGYEMVWQLDLSRNEIDHIGEDFYRTQLYKLNLNYNKLTQVDWNIIRSVWGLDDHLGTRENPWICNEDTLAFRDYLNDWLRKGGWNMSHFSCNKTAVTHSLLLQTNSNFTVKKIVAFILLPVLLTVLLCVSLFIIYWCAKNRMQRLRKMKHVDEKVLPTGLAIIYDGHFRAHASKL